ncbi:hypothetical protein DA075_22085 [Methylobacterium currus]|uniref:Uncharacterized protein n=1 Tax=Methylobacterium currus TaxID=2051553 RepID=A0A2R4WNX6_9HYPH|nr:hypothetical protein [Methylobacterium currus]AWB23257.1 hypothetical protein DA075_22085 [Methylobacterium currus]UHC17301.1 hypothetical protein LRS73_05245 [Methylobacterium currus]
MPNPPGLRLDGPNWLPALRARLAEFPQPTDEGAPATLSPATAARRPTLHEGIAHAVVLILATVLGLLLGTLAGLLIRGAA